ncbi:MAG: Holliday junction branch migration protein RuvA [Planctomycetota bacterium]
MISRIEGQLNALGDDAAALIVAPGVTIDVLLPPIAVDALRDRVGQRVELHTHLFLESQGQGVVMLPRLAGFTSPADRAFYLLLTGVKGIGLRRGLRVLAMPVADIASAVVGAELAVIQKLPEIGKKTAESLVLALRDKVAPFVSLDELAGGAPSGSRGRAGVADVVLGGSTELAGAAGLAVATLVQLGEEVASATRRVQRVMLAEPGLEESDQAEPIVAAALRFEG